jgi:4a-hydroxytetrahydrobiopterin dehydratase
MSDPAVRLDHPLLSRKCRPLGRDALLGDAELAAQLAQLPGWAQRDGAIAREYAFRDHWETMAFVNALAWISHREDHHPDIALGYNRCTVRYLTHTAGGVTINDLICAAKADALFALC